MRHTSTARNIPTISSLVTFNARPKAVVRRAVGPCGADQVAAADQQARALRPADDLAAAVRDQVGALRDVRIRHDQVVCRGIHQDRNAGLARDRRDVFQIEAARLPKWLPSSSTIAVCGLMAARSSSGVLTSMIFTPRVRMA